MMVYLDINVVFDYLVGRQPFGNEAAQVLTILCGDHAKVFMAPNAVIMAFTIMQ
jgi:predicted nucleic acid-binding protein